jgi:hypothetical protein
LTKRVSWVLDVDIKGFFDAIEALATFRHKVGRYWHHALSRRSQRGRVLWDRMKRLIEL